MEADTANAVNEGEKADTHCMNSGVHRVERWECENANKDRGDEAKVKWGEVRDRVGNFFIRNEG
jgi:hypothetical protein